MISQYDDVHGDEQEIDAEYQRVEELKYQDRANNWRDED